MSKSQVKNRRKAILAIAFASGLLGSLLPAQAEDNAQSVEDAKLLQIQNEKISMPGKRAFSLLLLAIGLSDGKDNWHAKWTASQSQNSWFNRHPKAWDDLLVSWADRVAADGRPIYPVSLTTKHDRPDKISISSQNRLTADKAIQEALMLADKSSSQFARLNVYFIASLLYKKTGNMDKMQNCNKFLEDAIQSCEENPTVDDEQIRAVSSVLNSMANAILPVYIPEFPLAKTANVSFTNADFKESEKLKRRAVELADRLDVTDHVRRKAHRDLALWYLQLGKSEWAEVEKSILFELVGKKDESILYPQSVGCGQIVWWQSKTKGEMMCGMG